MATPTRSRPGAREPSACGPRGRAPGFRPERVDLWGQISAMVGLTALAAATIEGGSQGFASPLVLGGYGLSAAAGVTFLALERAQARPILPLSLFRSATFSAAATIGLLINVAFYGLIFVFSLFFQRVQHLSALRTGLAFVPMTAAVMVANVLAGRLAGALRPRRAIALGALLMAAGVAALLGAGAGTPHSALVGQYVALGLGIGLIVPVMPASLLGSVESSRSGVASGTLNTAHQTGSVIGVALYGSLISHGRLVSGLHLALTISLAAALAVAALSLGITPEAPS